ncbi:MAG TPA: BrxA/BrxB family bacilliredoxin [Thermoanaerobaculia bacterium]|nr:BrxA/BrxB family bacilliredoxin [Thermoanaerobaculia bacterium]
MPYAPMMVQPMREELTRLGFRELTTPEEVDRAVAEASDPMLLVVNSICGCAAGVARPGVALSLQNSAAPKRLATVFAGQDIEATARARSYFDGLPPSSPQVAILAKGRLLFMLQRHEIEGRTPEQVAAALTAAYQRLNLSGGPSGPPSPRQAPAA